MYKVLIVDDEPVALRYMRSIIEKKCPDYRVEAQADNGRDALRIIEESRPDVVISDVRMPVMDGLQLVSAIKSRYPEILSVIVSGYQEFDYVKEAIQSGVCDYLLKPLKPADLQHFLEGIRPRLLKLYYERRKAIIKALCRHTQLPEGCDIQRCFPEGGYYSVIIRRNGIPQRFGRSTGVELFSMEEEKFYLYGRDEMEALYLFPESLLPAGESFAQVAGRLFEKELSGRAYVTAVVYSDKFELGILDQVMDTLYRKLDEAVIVGRNRLIQSREESGVCAAGRPCAEQLEYLLYLIKYKETAKLMLEFKKVFGLWEQKENTQLDMEGKTRYLFQCICDSYEMPERYADVDFEIDDIFSCSADMRELWEGVSALLGHLLPAREGERTDDKEQLFYDIFSYMESHLKESLSIRTICREFGLSQTTLSKLFRTCKDTSFGNCLTMLRMERAKWILENDPDSYIKDVAERVGYGDQFYFSRIFRSVVGVCPSEYCEKARKGDATAGGFI